ncbi:unnamed protein product, partial [Rotaria sordida]
MMSMMIDQEFQYRSTSYQPFTIVTVSDVRDCQIACLAQVQCRTANFRKTTNQCQLFTIASSQTGIISANMGTAVMTIIDGTRVPP